MKEGAQKKATARHRARQKRKGMVRLEVQVPKQDVATIREISRILRGEDERAAALARSSIAAVRREATSQARSAKELLLAMPTEIPLTRIREFPRDVDI